MRKNICRQVGLFCIFLCSVVLALPPLVSSGASEGRMNQAKQLTDVVDPASEGRKNADEIGRVFREILNSNPPPSSDREITDQLARRTRDLPMTESLSRFRTEDAQRAYGLHYFGRLLEHVESFLGSIQTRRTAEKDPAKVKGLQIQEKYFADARQTLESELNELREAEATAKKKIPAPMLKGPVTVPIGDVHAVSVLFGSGTHSALDGPAGEPTTGNVNVHVSTKGTPITLLLMAYWPVDWHLTIEPGTQILSVVARGLYDQKVIGLPRSVPIDSASFKDGWQYFTTELITKDRYLDFREEVRKMLGREPVTVQSQRRGKDFSVDGNMTISFTDSEAGGQAGTVILTSRMESVAKTMSQVFLSSDKLTVGYCCAGPFTESKASVAYNTGKRYVEFVLSRANGVNGMSRWTDVGLMSPGRDTYRFDTRENSNGYGVLGLLSERTQLADGDIIGLAIDLGSSRLYFRRNGDWINGDPERGSGGMSIKPGRDYAAAVTAAAPERRGEASDRWTANFGGRSFVYQLPKDFLPYQARN